LVKGVLNMYPHNNFHSEISTNDSKMQYKDITKKNKYIRYFYIDLSNHADYI